MGLNQDGIYEDYVGVLECLRQSYVDIEQYLSRIVRKPDFALAKTKAKISFVVTAKLFSAFVDTISLLLKSEISSFLPTSVTVQVGLCRTWSETLKTGFLASRLI